MARMSVRPCCFNNPCPSSPPYQALSPPTDYQTGPPSSPNASPPLSPITTPRISPCKFLLTLKSSPPLLTSPPPTPTQPFKQSSPLTKTWTQYYSMYGHVEKLAHEIQKGAESVGGIEAKLWQPAGVFYSTSTQGGGQESTPLTALTQLVHHGMIFVPIGYTFGDGMSEMGELKGGSPYGAGTFSGDGSRVIQARVGASFSSGKARYRANFVPITQLNCTVIARSARANKRKCLKKQMEDEPRKG
nr:probable NAD(P)H dehydrogenase (quinone) FQR1-like 1 [Tanacetum cinerariifolium]